MNVAGRMWVLSLSLSLLVSPVFAQAPGVDDALPLSDEALGLQNLTLDELLEMPLRTGSFLDLDLRSSPVSLTVIDRPKIQVSGARHLGELLELYVPGFQFMFNKWNGMIWGLRGVAADRNTKVIFLVNGLKQNTESRDGAYTESSLGLLGDVERVEVLRGPAGLVYGSGAIAGVVNVVTRTPKLTSGEASVKAGNWNSQQAEALAHAQLAGTRSLTVGAGLRRSDGVGRGQTRIFGAPSWPAPASPLAGMVADGSAWALSESPNLRVSLDVQHGEFRLYSRFTRQAESMGAFFLHDPWPEIQGVPADGPERWVDGRLESPSGPYSSAESWGSNRRLHLVDNLSVQGTWKRAVGLDLVEAELSWVGTTNRIQREYRSGYGAGAAFIDSTMGEKRYQARVQYLLHRVARLQSAFGLQYRLDDLGRDLAGLNFHGGVETHPEISQIVYHSLGAYTENQYTLVDELALLAGLRLDLHTRTSPMLNPRLAAVWRPHPNHTVKLVFQMSSNNGSTDNYEYNWRHFRDDGSVDPNPHLERATDPNSSHIPATREESLHQLEPERALSVELSSTNRLLKGLVVTPSVSYNSISNLFAWNQDLFRVVNAGEYAFVAAELDASLEMAGVVAGLSHAFQRPVSSSGSRQITIPVTRAVPNDDGTYRLEETGETRTVTVDPVKDGVTSDGRNFLNLVTNVTKVHVTYSPLTWLHLHTNLRLFWGLRGRSELIAQEEAAGWDYLGVGTGIIAKWNVGALVDLPHGFRLSVHGYDLLGGTRSLNSVRWQQAATGTADALYTVDQPFVLLGLEKSFR